MFSQARTPGHPGSFVQGPGSWVTAIIIAILINLGVLSLMPKLLGREAATPQGLTDIHTVDLFKAKPPAALIKKPFVKKTEKLERKPVPAKNRAAARPPVDRLSLPFRIEARLPEGIGIHKLPPIESVVLDGTGLKDAFNQAELDNPLIPVSQIPPVYPLRARRQGIEGWVAVKFLVNRDGRVESVSILDSNPPKVFDQSVLRCVRAWHFKSGTISGVPVNTWVETTVKFKLK